MRTLLLKNGRLIDPDHQLDIHGDLLIEDGRIAEIGHVERTADEEIDCSRHIVCPGLIELHAAVRDPGFEEDETTATATAAAIAGGF